MARAFKLPDLGEGIHEGEILKVIVSAGDEVKEGDPILEVGTDKAAVEIPSPYSGKVEEVKVKEGDTVRVGDVLILYSDGEKEAPEKPKPEPEKREKPEAKPTSEAKPKAEAKSAPEVKPEAKEKPETAKEKDAEEKEEPQGKPELEERPKLEEKPKPEEKRPEGPVPASPSTRRLARELGVDLGQVAPSGPAGLVTAEDVKAFAGRAKEEKPKPLPEKRAEARPRDATAPALPDFSKWGGVEKKPLRSIRRATAKQMTLAWSQIPHVNNQDRADMTRLEEFRQKHKAEVEKKGGKLTTTVFALKVLPAVALKQLPQFNASLDTAAGEIVLKHYYHLGVAVSTEEGLVVPVIRDVDRKSITELAVELNGLVQRTRNRKVSLDELQGGTFTITNVGGMGGGYFAPIINYPEVAILGMGSMRMEPVVKEIDGRFEIVPRLMMPVIVCIDHRVLDGADAIAFMKIFIDALEDPEELMLTMT